MQKPKISFPHMGNYYIVANYLFNHIIDAEIMTAPKITSKTIELGTKYSPDFVCTPFKYTLGTMIEALDNGANILFQAGGGCKYGYYAELQEQILKDLGYEFNYINLISQGRTDLKKICKYLKEIDKKFNTIKVFYYLFIASKMVKYMDKIDNYINISITDFAGGLPREVQDRLFKEMVTTKGKNGTGLGLYMSYSNVKAHFGGDITYKTEEGKGTTFNILIPINK